MQCNPENAYINGMWQHYLYTDWSKVWLIIVRKERSLRYRHWWKAIFGQIFKTMGQFYKRFLLGCTSKLCCLCILTLDMCEEVFWWFILKLCCWTKFLVNILNYLDPKIFERHNWRILVDHKWSTDLSLVNTVLKDHLQGDMGALNRAKFIFEWSFIFKLLVDWEKVSSFDRWLPLFQSSGIFRNLNSFFLFPWKQSFLFSSRSTLRNRKTR